MDLGLSTPEKLGLPIKQTRAHLAVESVVKE